MLSMKPNINKSRGKSVFLKPNDMFFLVRFESLDPEDYACVSKKLIHIFDFLTNKEGFLK
jgi:hypothetical protein